MITAPGVYDLTEDEYHADPVDGGSLSSTGARKLLPPNCPALYRHYVLNPEHKRVFDYGRAAHREVLGVGSDLVVVDADDWRTKAAQAERDAAYADGLTPILREEYTRVKAMADALRAHPIASRVFLPDHGSPEQSLVWKDNEFGVWRRARLDWLPSPAPGRKTIVADYKTCVSAEPKALQKSIHNYGYHQQADWYLAGVEALELAEDPDMVFVFQEKQPPFLITVAQVDAVALRIARERNRRAMAIYRECVAANHWPAYSEEIELVALPAWAEAQELETV